MDAPQKVVLELTAGQYLYLQNLLREYKESSFERYPQEEGYCCGYCGSEDGESCHPQCYSAQFLELVTREVPSELRLPDLFGCGWCKAKWVEGEAPSHDPQCRSLK